MGICGCSHIPWSQPGWRSCHCTHQSRFQSSLVQWSCCEDVSLQALASHLKEPPASARKVDKEISSRSEHFKHSIHKHEAQMKFHISLNSLTQTHELTALRSFLIKAMGLRFKPLWNLLPKYQPIKPYNQSEKMEIILSYTFLHYIFCCTAEEILTSTIILPYKLLVGIHSRWIMNMVEKQKSSETLETLKSSLAVSTQWLKILSRPLRCNGTYLRRARAWKSSTSSSELISRRASRSTPRKVNFLNVLFFGCTVPSSASTSACKRKNKKTSRNKTPD